MKDIGKEGKLKKNKENIRKITWRVTKRGDRSTLTVCQRSSSTREQRDDSVKKKREYSEKISDSF